MWRLMLVALLLVDGVPAPGQSKARPNQNDHANIQASIQELNLGIYSGIAKKQLERAGDEVAIVAMNAYTLDELADTKTNFAIANAISISFEQPGLIANESDKMPKLSIILLNYLKSVATENSDKVALNAASAIVEKQYSTLRSGSN